MLAADAHLEGGPCVPSLGGGHLHQAPHARLVQRGKGVLLEDAGLQIRREEVVDVVARDAERGLRQIVGAEAEELGLLGDLVGGQGGARQLDHRAHHVVHRRALLLEDLRGNAADNRRLVAHLFNGADERNHDLQVRLAAVLLHVDRGLEDGPRLHLGDLGERDAKTAAAQPEHGIHFMQLLHPGQKDAKILQLG